MKQSFKEFSVGLEELDINEQLSMYNDYEFNYLADNTKNFEVKNLKEPVPVNIRLETYKEALSFIENKVQKFDIDYRGGLCMILPMTLWGMESMFEKTPDGSCWSWRDTTTAFPEFKKRDIERIHKSEKYLLVRKNILKRCINTLNKII